MRDDPIAHGTSSPRTARPRLRRRARAPATSTRSGPLLLASHASLRDDYRVSTPELDLLVDAARGARRDRGAADRRRLRRLRRRARAAQPRRRLRGEDRRSPTRSGPGREPKAFVVRAVDGAGTPLAVRRCADPPTGCAPGPRRSPSTRDFAPIARGRPRSTGTSTTATDAAARAAAASSSSSAGAGSGKADDDEWRKVVVPDNFGADEEFSDYFGAMSYRRKFADPRIERARGQPARGAPRASRRSTTSPRCGSTTSASASTRATSRRSASTSPTGCRRTTRCVVRVQDPLEPLDPDALLLRPQEADHQGHAEVPRQPARRAPRPHAPPASRATTRAVVWTPEWGQSMTTAGIVGPVTLERTGDVAIDALLRHAARPRDRHGPDRGRRSSTTRRRAAPPPCTSRVGDDHAALDVHARARAPHRVDAVTDLPELDRWEPVHSPHGRAGAPRADRGRGGRRPGHRPAHRHVRPAHRARSSPTPTVTRSTSR